jgi:predicted CXXCH cytochrome family protein
MHLHRLILILCLALPAGLQAAETCVTADCHATYKTGKAPHSPVAEGDCLSCHKKVGAEHPLKGQKTFELTAKVPELCYQCHDPYKKKVVHAPVKEGDCLSCHKVHGGANKYLLPVGSDLTSLCSECHDPAAMKGEFVHGPVAAGECTACHSPHDSVEKKLMKGKGRELCSSCHDDFGSKMKEAKVIHAPVQIDNCTACHSPHAGPSRYFLKKKVTELCLGCHGKIAKKHNDSKVKHKPLAQDEGCSGCHTSHYSSSKGLLRTGEKDMCLTCHGVDKLGNPPLRNMKKELEKKKYLHGPIQKDRCTPCHDPHGSNNYRLTKGNYPSQIYTPYKDDSYSLCLTCHEKNLLKYPETTVYTRFRNGNKNLHFVHVSNKTKGRSCKLCHEIHASEGDKLISPIGSRFGNWNIPLRFKQTSTGGSCAPGCHRPFEYDREKPVDYLPLTPGEGGEKGEEAPK